MKQKSYIEKTPFNTTPDYRGYTFYHTHMPYCLRRISQDRWAVLNRQNKPVGYLGHERVNYEDFAVPMSIRLSLIKKLSCNGSEDGSSILLYNTSCRPWDSAEKLEAYHQRLDLLAKVKIRTGDKASLERDEYSKRRKDRKANKPRLRLQIVDGQSSSWVRG